MVSESTSPRVRPIVEGAAVVLLAVAGWYCVQPWLSRLRPAGVATDDRSTKAIIGDAIVDIAPRSRLDVRSNDPRATKVFIERGQATFDLVPRRQPPAPFEVYTGDLLVVARDARFTLTCWHEASSLAVERGVVEVEANERRFSVSAGERWPGPPGARD